MSGITILIADDQPLIRDGLAAILGMEDGYTVVAKAGDGLTALAQVRLHRPQLVMMDIHMPKIDGLEATRQIKKEFPDIKVLILTTFEDDAYIWEAISHGASGFLVKGVDTGKMLATIQDCLEGRLSYPSSIQPRLVRAIQAAEQQDRRLADEAAASLEPDRRLQDEVRLGLTLQERNIVSKLQEGKSNQAIAAELYLTPGTVKNYLSAIYRKLKVSNRSEAMAYLHKHER